MNPQKALLLAKFNIRKEDNFSFTSEKKGLLSRTTLFLFYPDFLTYIYHIRLFHIVHLQ